jgi:flagellar protein FlaG
MRVEGQRMATDYTVSNLNQEQSKIVNDKERSTNQTKISVDEVKKQPKKEEIKVATSIMNEVMKMSNHHLQFRLHEDSGRIQVKVIDSESQKVIREIPPEKILECSAMIKNLMEEMAGILLDEVI